MFRRFSFFLLFYAALALAEPDNAAELVPANVLQLPDSVANVLIVDTGASTLYQFSNHDQVLGVPQERYVSIGQNGVGKRRPGDRRTPLGIYFISEQLDTSKLHEKYGPTAFPLDYPNERDRLLQRGGDGIWIHGVVPGNGRRPPLDTDGCIALGNTELLELADVLVPHTTPVLITRKIHWGTRETVAAIRKELNAALELWRQSLLTGDMHAYISLYDNDFRYRSMNRDEWIAYRLPSFATVLDKVSLEEVVLLADPEEKGVYLSRFRQEIVKPERSVVTKKRLYWQRSDDGNLKIIAEDNG